MREVELALQNISAPLAPISGTLILGLATTAIGWLTIDQQRHAKALGRYGAVTNDDTRGGLSSWRLRLIDERLAEPMAAPTLSELARLCHLSVRALTRGFKESRGTSLGGYVVLQQLGHAKRLLASGNSVKSVTHTLGFASSASFCYAFKRSAGLTPNAFRERELRGKCRKPGPWELVSILWERE